MIPGFDLRDAIGGSFGTHLEKNTAIFADDTKDEQIAIIEFPFGLAGPQYQPGVLHSGSTRISEIEIYHK
jgi:hypothetical protein